MRNLKKFLALVLATLMVVGAMVATTVSAAEADHSKAVTVLNRVDVYRGYGKDVMGENDLVTRWHMALFVSRMTTGFTDDSHWNGDKNDTPFTDVTKNNYLGAISSAYKAGIILGIGDNKFDPNANIKYVDALTMVVRALGYKDLDYPLGFVQKAQALGLTDNLNELDNKLDTAITRGQTAEIIYNALFVECKDGTILARDVLKLQLADGVIIATPKQALEASKLAPKGKVILEFKVDDKHIKYIELNAAELLEDGETVEDLLGYSYKVATNNNWETLVTAFRCASKTLYNYGTEKNEITYVQQGYAPNQTKRNNMIKLEGTNYNWNGEVVSSSATNFVAYELSGNQNNGQVVPKIHYYDTNKNIVDLDGKILLYYMDGMYWKSVTAGKEVLVQASKADFDDALKDYAEGALDTVSYYSVIAQKQSNKVWDNKFCELKVFDDDGDGKWDRGIFTPYCFGQIVKVIDLDKNGNERYDSDGKPIMVLAVRYNNGQNDIDYRVSKLTFTGKTFAEDDFVLFTINGFTGVLDIKTNLGTYKSGKATEFNGTGSYAVIDGKKQIFNLNENNLRGYNNDISINMIKRVIADGTYVIGYIAEAGYLLKTSPINPYGYVNYVAFTKDDIVKIDNAGNLVVKAIIDATGDKKEIKISDMYQYDPEAKYNKPAKIGALIAFELKKMEVVQSGDGNSELANFMEGASAPAAQTATATKDQILAAYDKAVAGDGLNHKMCDYLNTTVYAGKLNANGTYSLVPFTPDIPYDPTDAVNKFEKDEVNIVDNVTKDVIAINYGINNKPYVSEVAKGDEQIAQAGKFDTTSSVVYIFAGKDKIQVFKGVAKTGSEINLSGAKTFVLNANANCVFVYDGTKTAAELHNDKFVAPADPVPTAADKDYEFYAVVKGTSVVVENVETGKFKLTIKDLQNVVTGETKSLTVIKSENDVMAIYNAINEKYDVTNASKACATVFFVSVSEKKFEYSETTEQHKFKNAIVQNKFEEYVGAVWTNAKYTDPYMGVDVGKLNDQYLIDLESEADIPVQSFEVKVFWGDGTVETITGPSEKYMNDLTAHKENGNKNNDIGFIAVNEDGAAVGYVFAPLMANDKK